MKSVLAISVLVAAAAAQDLAACAQTCLNNMNSAAKAQELGCKQADMKCLCANQNYMYGIRDCSTAVCGGEDAKKAVEYGISICGGAGVHITTGADGSATKTGEDGNGGSGGSVSTIYTTFTSDGKVVTSAIATTTLGGSGGDDDNNSGSVSKFTSVITGTDGKVVTTTGEVTLTDATGSGSATATATESGATSGAMVTTVTSGGTAIIKTLTTMTSVASGSETGTATGTGSNTDDSGSATDSATGSGSETGGSGAATSTSSDDAGIPQMTAAPVGVLAAAGLAILLL